jgi:Gpi18-like mannosyltransferase
MENYNKTNNQNLLDKSAPYIFILLSVTALLIARFSLFFYQSGDYVHFLKIWLDEYRTMTFLEGLGTTISNYNPPYMYILNIIARINIPDLVLIKIVSVVFDFIIAYFVMKIVALKTDRLNMHILAFVLTFAIPTVVINSAMWGQCDSIYAAFAIGSFYFGMARRSKMSYAFMALAIAFKLQAAFLLPILAIFVITRNIRFKDCYIFFVVYLATLLPAMLTGMPWNEALLAYVEQAGYYRRLSQNMVNIWRFIYLPDDLVPFFYEGFAIAGIFMTAVAVLGLMYFTYVNRTRLTNTVDFVRLAYLFAVIIPFMLPKMHDRYYFMADVLAVTLLLFDKKRWYVPVVTIFCSLISYEFFLIYWTRTEVIEYKYFVVALLFVILIVLKDYVKSLSDISSDDISATKPKTRLKISVNNIDKR